MKAVKDRMSLTAMSLCLVA